jgi:hypothetical protein
MLDPVRNPDETLPEARSGQVPIANAERTRPARHISVRTQDAENWANGRTSYYAHDRGDTGYSKIDPPKWIVTKVMDAV